MIKKCFSFIAISLFLGFITYKIVQIQHQYTEKVFVIAELHPDPPPPPKPPEPPKFR